MIYSITWEVIYEWKIFLEHLKSTMVWFIPWTAKIVIIECQYEFDIRLRWYFLLFLKRKPRTISELVLRSSSCTCIIKITFKDFSVNNLDWEVSNIQSFIASFFFKILKELHEKGVHSSTTFWRMKKGCISMAT